MSTSSSSPPRLIDSAGLWNARLWQFESLPSTNQWALEHFHECRHGDVVQAVRQTAGRGRFNRKWMVPEDRGLAVSVVLDSRRIAPESVSLLGPATALAVRETLAGLGIVDPQVKWPNDVLVGGKKIAGILAESHGSTEAIVVGIGLNVNLTTSDLQGMDLLHPATSMVIESGRTFELSGVLSALVRHMEAMLALAMAAPPQRRELWSNWTTHDALRGQRVRVDTPAGVKESDYLGVADDGALRLRLTDGKEQLLYSGDATKVSPAR